MQPNDGLQSGHASKSHKSTMSSGTAAVAKSCAPTMGATVQMSSQMDHPLHRGGPHGDSMDFVVRTNHREEAPVEPEDASMGRKVHVELRSVPGARAAPSKHGDSLITRPFEPTHGHDRLCRECHPLRALKVDESCFG